MIHEIMNIIIHTQFNHTLFGTLVGLDHRQLMCKCKMVVLCLLIFLLTFEINLFKRSMRSTLWFYLVGCDFILG
jgi:hypothetical protein